MTPDIPAFEYSYDRLNQELIEHKCFDYAQYGKQNPLEWLCRQYFHKEQIGDYDQIEWQALHINQQVLTDLTKWIDNNYESARILFHLLKHAHELIPEPDQDAFSDECCRLIDKLYHQNKPRISLQANGETYPNMKRMLIPDSPLLHADTFKQSAYKLALGSILIGSFRLRDKTLLPLLPVIPHQDNGAFTTQTIFESAFNVRTEAHVLLQSKTTDEERQIVTHVLCEHKTLEFSARKHLTHNQNRLLHGRTLPVIQTLFIVCVYFAADDNFPEFEPYYSACVAYLKDKLIQDGVKPDAIDKAIEILKKALAQPFAKKDQAVINLQNSEMTNEMQVFAYPDEARKIKAVYTQKACTCLADWGAVFKILVDFEIFELNNYQAGADLINASCGKQIIKRQNLIDSPALKIIGGNIKTGKWFNNAKSNPKSASKMITYNKIAQVYLNA